MGLGFRLAFGPCRCSKGSPSHHAGERALCELVLAHLERLRHMRSEQLLALPEEEQEKIVIQGLPAQLTVIRESFPDGTTLVVVRGFLSTWSHPTFISFTSFDVGRVVAEGLLVDEGGTVTDAPDEDMWHFR